MQTVAECHIAVADTEDDVHHRFTLLRIGDYGLIGTIVYMALLDVTQLIAFSDLAGLNTLLLQPLGKVTDVCYQTEGRGFYHLLTLVIDTIRGFPLIF